jgi:glycine cleavage system transcriptional repressor
MQTDQKEYVISITSRDRVGIIHDVAGAISYMNGDLADMRQQVLRGYFTMILHVTFPAAVSTDEIRKRLTAAGTSDAAIEVSIKAVHQPQPETSPPMDNCYVLTADGEDRIGFVATVTKFCKDNAVNILDLTTTVADGRYIMILFIDLSSCPAMDELRDSLDRFAHDTDLNMVLQHYDIFRATNEIKVF